MCGRYSLATDPEGLLTEFGLEELPEDLTARYNIAPTQPVAVVTNREPKRARMHHFGLIPHWADSPAIGNRMINARRETLAQKPAYREPFRTHRCLVLADGFYEWKRTPGGKQPFYFHLGSDRPFGFAGLWAVWRGAGGQVIPSCTIVTAPARGAVADVHERMPVIVPPELRAAWLAPDVTDPETLAPLLDATPVDELVARPVSTYVNRPQNEGPACIEETR